MELGDKLGRYTITKKIGSGGMGEVYLAKDEQLDRNVALKVLLPEFCCDLERVKRFKFEAKAVSAINHPGIITIHEIAEEGENLFIATEFIDGITLREKIENKELSVFESVHIAEQIADALAIAHEENIVHRDVKPENIMIRKDGYAKILDFGLAKPILQNITGAEDATIQMVKTQPGMVMGSVRYMSPEQARGKETDGRTDVWSLGVVLYEMLTGENPFDGETISDSLAAVIHETPKKPENIQDNLVWAIEKALSKKPEERYQNIKDLAKDLRDIRKELERESDAHSKAHLAQTETLSKQDTSENKTLIHKTISAENTADTPIDNKTRVNMISEQKQSRSGIAYASVGLIAVIVLSGWFFLPNFFEKKSNPFQSIQVSRFTDTGNASRAAVSPDGKMVVFVENQENKGKLLLRQIATGGTVEIVPFTDKGFYRPEFSPSGDFIYYVSYKDGVGTLYSIPTLGGKNSEIIGDIDSYVTFSPDGERLAFIRHNSREGGSEIIMADKDGKNEAKFLSTQAINFERFKSVEWSADGKKILLSGIEKSNVDYKKIKALTVDVESKKTDEPFWLKELNEQIWWSSDSFAWMKDDSGVVFIGNPEDSETRQVYHISFADGKMSRVTNDISNYESLSISNDSKTLVVNKLDVFTKLSSYNPKTDETKEILPEDKKYAFWAGFSQTSDGKILFPKIADGSIFIYKINEDGGSQESLISNLKYNFNPILTSDEKYIVYRSSQQGQSRIWRAGIDGSSPKQLTKKELGYVSDIESSPDAEFVYFTSQKREGGKTDIMRVSIDGGKVEEVLSEPERSVRDLKFSPDGDYVAYRTSIFDNETQKFIANVVIAEFDGNKIGKKVNEFEMSIESRYRWSPDSKFVTFMKKDGSDNLWNLDIKSGKQTQLTNFKSEFLPQFIWSKKGDKLFVVEGKVNNDLVLIKSDQSS